MVNLHQQVDDGLGSIKQTELIFDAKTIDYEDIVKLKDNVKFLSTQNSIKIWA